MVGKGHEADMIVSKGIYTRKTSVLVHGNSHDLIHTGHDLSVAIQKNIKKAVNEA